jgi:hypothetical protein
LQELDGVVPCPCINLKVVWNGEVGTGEFNPDEIIAASHIDNDVIGYALRNKHEALAVNSCTRTPRDSTLDEDDVVIMAVTLNYQVSIFNAHLHVPGGCSWRRGESYYEGENG